MLSAIPVSAFIAAMTIMLAFPQTPAAKGLHHALVEAPVRFFFDLTWNKAGKLALSGAAIGLMMLMGPQMLTTMLAIGVDAAVLEIVILGWLVSASGRITTAYRLEKRPHSAFRSLARHIAIRPGHGRKPGPRRKSRQKTQKDDEPAADWAFA